MHTNDLAPRSLAELSSDAITTRLAELRGAERLSLVEFLRYLGEMDRRRTYLELGYPSLFAYCTDALGLPKASAFRRTTSARLLARFPIIAEYLADGRLCLTTLVLLKDVLEPENHRELLDRAAGGTEQQVEVLVASLRPRPEVQESIRRLPTRPGPEPAEPPTPSSSAASTRDTRSGPEPRVEQATLPTASSHVVPTSPGQRGRLQPIDAERHSLKMTVGPEFMAELAEVKAALSHLVPDGNLEAVLRVCFQKTLELCARRKRAARSTPARVAPEASEPAKECAPKMPRKNRTIPAEVRRAVWERDRGSCSFVGANGKRCGSTFQLEFDHQHPFALGGEASVANLALRCRNHNLHRARIHFGEAHMAKFKRDRSAADRLHQPEIGENDAKRVCDSPAHVLRVRRGRIDRSD